MNNWGRRLTGLCLISMVCLARDAGAATVLRFAEGTANRGARAEAVRYFVDQVEDLSGGTLQIKMYWAGALLELASMLDGLAYGTADIGTLLAAYFPKPLKGLAIGDIPILSSDPWVGMRAMYALMSSEPQLQAMMRDQNVVYLGNFSSTGAQLGCVGGTRIDRVADIHGKRFRAVGAYAKILYDLGAHLVNLTAADEYQALDSGLLDCTATYFYLMRSYRTYEVLEHITRVDWGQLLGFVMAINLDTWQALNPRQQQILHEAGSRMIDRQAELLINETAAVAEAIQTGSIGRTIPVTPMRKSERLKFIKAAQPYIDCWIEEASDQGLDGKRLWERYRELVKHFEEQRDTMGYPWARNKLRVGTSGE